MRPYLAVIRDSFREALASRVLWILVVVITLALVGFVPVAWRRQLSTGLRIEDMRDVRALVSALQSAGQAAEPSPAQTIWLMLPDQTQRELEEFLNSQDKKRMSDFPIQRQLAKELNRMLERDNFFREDLWKDAELTAEARELIARGPGQLSELEQGRLNRLALEAALPGYIRAGPPQSVVFSYLVWDLGEPLTLSDQQIHQAMAYALSIFISIVVGFVGVIAAILVTASIIPNMFDAGSVALLLSKPISRSLLFLSKFAGGCWFVLIVGAYLIGGLWLVLGWRLDYWQHRLLLCIPILLFLFLVYYSVSALAGLIWRNTIVAVMVTILFWLVCTMVGSAKVGIEMFFVHPNRLVKIVPTGDDLVALSERGVAHQWDKTSGQWQDILVSEDARSRPPFARGPATLGPVYDSRHQRLVSIESGWSQRKLLIGHRADQWKRVEKIEVPQATRQLLVEPDGNILLVANNEFHRLQDQAPGQSGRPEATQGTQLPSEGNEGAGPRGHVNVSTLQKMAQAIMTGVTKSVGRTEQFRVVGPVPSSSVGRAVALNQDDGAVFSCDGRMLKRFELRENGDYETRQTVQMEDKQQQVVVAAGGNNVLLAWEDGRVQLLDAQRLEVLKVFVPEGRNQPRFAVASPEGRWFAVLFHHRRLWILDGREQTVANVRIAGQGDISAVSFSGSNRLLVVDRSNRVSQYHLPDGKLQQRQTPPSTTMESIYRYVIKPIYTVFPKPGEMDNSISYLLTERETVQVGPRRDNDLSSAQLKVDPWAPLWSSLVFVLGMLVIACAYLHRQDF